MQHASAIGNQSYCQATIEDMDESVFSVTQYNIIAHLKEISFRNRDESIYVVLINDRSRVSTSITFCLSLIQRGYPNLVN